MLDWTANRDYREINELPGDLRDFVSLDLEGDSSGLDMLKEPPFCVQISDRPGRAFLIWKRDLHILQPLLDSRRIVFHTATGDVLCLENAGLKVDWSRIEDVMMQAHCIDSSNPAKLKEKAARDLFINHPEWSADLYRSPETFLRYSCGDADITIQEHELYYPQVMNDRANKRAYKIEMGLTPILASMERVGVRLDANKLCDMQAIGIKILEKLESHIYKAAGVQFNVNAPKQVGQVLFDKLGLEAKEKTKGGKPSTNKEALQAIEDQHVVVKLIMTYRRVTTTCNTSIGGLLKGIASDGRVHTTYLQAAAPTKRLASIKPSLLNQPKRAKDKLDKLIRPRKAFIPSEDYQLVAADASQIELRLMIFSTGNKRLIEALNSGVDFHRVTGRLITEVVDSVRKKLSQISKEERERGKTFNYALPYGMDKFGLSRRLDISVELASAIFKRMRGVFGPIFDWVEREKKWGKSNGASRTIFGGRLRSLPALQASNKKMRMKAERNIVNDKVQGGAAEIFKLGLINLFRKKPASWNMLIPIHDECLLEIPKSEANEESYRFIRDSLCQEFKGFGSFPYDVSIGPNWQDMEEIKFKS